MSIVSKMVAFVVNWINTSKIIVMTPVTLFIFKFLTVAIIMAAMIIVLLGIRRLIFGDFKREREETESLKKELNHSSQVITNHSIFRSFLSGKKE